MAATVTTSVKLSPRLKARLKKLATSQRRTTHWVMREAITQYVSREERRARLHKDVVEAWEDYKATGLHITGEEADAWMRKLEQGIRAKPPKLHR
jgi:predicted transcriptional regulator